MQRRWSIIAALGMIYMATVVALADDPYEIKVPKGLQPLVIPDDNPVTAAKVELGMQLYFDPRLSSDGTVSCASCHDPEKGWSNGEAFATGIKGQKGGRSAPTIINSAYQANQFWDGRAQHLEGQALGPIQNPIEMGMTLDELCANLNKIAGYKKQFKTVFGEDDIKPEHVAKALAAFERTILSGDAPYDRFKAGVKDALTPAAQRGLKLFTGKAHCSACHSGANFTDGAYHNIGVGTKAEKPDVGRFEHSKLAGDTGAFKTPTLREISRTAPYMHDGSMKTLEDVVDYYDKGGEANAHLDEEIFPLKLTSEEKKDLLTFLREGLASPYYPLIKAPKLPE